MIEYYDVNGHLIEEGANLLYDKNKCFRCGIAKIVDNQLCFIYANGIDATVLDQFKVPLCEIDLSKIQILDIESFNASFDKKDGGIRYYDRFGLLIREEMGLFLSDGHGGGNGSPIEKINGDFVFGFGTKFDPHYESLSEFNRKFLIVDWISKCYTKQLQRKKSTKSDSVEIRFEDDEHEHKFDEICRKMKHLDCYHLSLAYLLSLDKVLREHTDEVFDFQEDGIKREGLHKGFQTSTSMKTTRLAFNLWNGCYDDGETYTNKDGYGTELPSSYYTPDQIFCCKDYAPYYWQAIRIRFELN